MRPRKVELDPGGLEDRNASRNRRGVAAMLVIAWAYGFFPNLITVFQNGRDRVVVDNVVPPAAAAQVLLKVLFVAFCLVAIWLLIRNIRTKVAPRNGSFVLLTLPFLVTTAASLVNGGKLSADTIIYPLAVFTYWRVQAPARTLVSVGWITVIGATLSFALGALVPDAGTTLPPIVGDKAYWPTLLAGPYSHPNVLGLGISMGIPFVFYIRRRSVRGFGIVVVALDVAWSGNRCSILALAICFAVYAVLHLRQNARKWTVFPVLAGAYLVISTPLTINGPDDYSYRGQIWAASFDFWKDRPWLGGGPDYYKIAAEYANDLGSTAFSGHNMMVHLLTTGGIFLLLAGGMLYIGAFGAGLRQPGLAGRISISFIVLSIFNGWLQNTITYTDLTELAFVGWMPLAVLMFAPREGEGPDFSADAAERSLKRLAESRVER